MRSFKQTILIFIIFTCFAANDLTAQEYYDSTVVAPVTDSVYEEEYSNEEEYSDTSTRVYERLYMDEDKLQALRSKKEFQYKDMDSLALKDTASIKPQTNEAEARRFERFDANILLWLLVAVGVIVLILQLTGVNLRQLFAPQRAPSVRNEDDFLTENIHDIPYEKAIQQAINAKDFSLATRLMYLQSLKLLSDKDLIAWHVNKTNWQYAYELKGEGLRDNFRNITYIFEYVQYGHMPISEKKFDVVQNAFKNFKMHVI
jgi:hypothetical protein